MAKDTYYFTHDYNARNDLKMAVLRENYGMEGVGIYWCLVEMLYEEGGYLNVDDLDDIAKTLRTNTTVLRNIVDSKLFKIEENRVYSGAVLERLKKREEKSQKARQSILKRYERNTNVYQRIPTNTIKGKESKVNNIYSVGFSLFWEKYPKKLAKRDAEKAFAKIAPDEKLLGIILTALEIWKQSEDWIKENGKYIPYPATWLNGRRWEDEIKTSILKRNIHDVD